MGPPAPVKGTVQTFAVVCWLAIGNTCTCSAGKCRARLRRAAKPTLCSAQGRLFVGWGLNLRRQVLLLLLRLESPDARRRAYPPFLWYHIAR